MEMLGIEDVHEFKEDNTTQLKEELRIYAEEAFAKLVYQRLLHFGIKNLLVQSCNAAIFA